MQAGTTIGGGGGTGTGGVNITNNNVNTQPRGDFNIATTYVLGDQVRYEKASYISKTESNTGNVPLGSTDHWQIASRDGSDGTDGLDGDSFSPAGNYSALTTYNKGDLVSSGTASYISRIASNTGNGPATSSTEWQEIARDGTDATGTAGVGIRSVTDSQTETTATLVFTLTDDSTTTITFNLPQNTPTPVDPGTFTLSYGFTQTSTPSQEQIDEFQTTQSRTAMATTSSNGHLVLASKGGSFTNIQVDSIDQTGSFMSESVTGYDSVFISINVLLAGNFSVVVS